MTTEKTAAQKKYDRELKQYNFAQKVKSGLMYTVGLGYIVGTIGSCVVNSGKPQSVELRSSESPAECVERFVEKQTAYASEKVTQNCFKND